MKIYLAGENGKHKIIPLVHSRNIQVEREREREDENLFGEVNNENIYMAGGIGQSKICMDVFSEAGDFP